MAREAGVSTKTVSKVINTKPGVNEATRKRVLDIVTSLGYHPHHGARTLRGKNRNCVGVTIAPPMDLVPLSEDFLIWLFAKLSTIFSAQGAYICFDINRYSPNSQSDYARGVWEQMYDVCVVVGPLPSQDDTMRRIHEYGMPYLALGRLDNFPECSSAAVNLEQGAYESTRFLIQRGHRRIALLTAFDGFYACEERLGGYRRALAEAGLPWDDRLVRNVHPVRDNLSDAVFRLLAESETSAVVDSTAFENGAALRDGCRKAGRTPGTDLDMVVWTYMENTAVMKEAAAHLWLPVRQVVIEGLERLSKWSSGETEGPIKVLYQPVLRAEQYEHDVERPIRIADLL